MATIYKKTVQYNLSTAYNPTDLTDATPSTVGTGSLYIAENTPSTPVKFTDVMLYTTLQDTSTATGATLAQTTTFISASVNGSAYSQLFKLPTTLTNTGENWSYTFGPLNGLSLFQNNFGNSETSSIQVRKQVDISSGTGTNTRAVYCYVEVTYEYSSSAPARTQTISIPLASYNNTLPATLTTMWRIPQLSGSGGLLENYGGLNIKDAWVEIKGCNSNANSTTDTTLTASYNSGGSVYFPTRESGLGTTLFERYFMPLPPNKSTSHTLELACGVASRYKYIGGFLHITFTYNPATTTRILNYVQLPVDLVSPLKSFVEGPNEWRNTITIQEPGPISTKYASLELYNQFSGNSNVLLKWDVSSSYTTFAQVGTQIACPYWIMYNRGPLPALSRGENGIYFKAYTTTANSGTGLTGLVHVLYESAIPSGSIDDASHCIKSLLGAQDGNLYSTSRLFSGSIPIPNRHYYKNSAGLAFHLWAGASVTSYGITAQRLSNEGTGSWSEVYYDSNIADGENGSFWIYAQGRGLFKDFPEDIRYGKLDLKRSRNWWYNGNSATRPGGYLFLNYHTITGSISGTINGIQTAATASLYRQDTREIQQIQYVSGSSFSFPTYLDTVKYYVDVYENNTYKGRSKSDYPGTGFDVTLTTGGGGTYSYTYSG